MRGHNLQLDERGAQELEEARTQHMAALEQIPRGDKELVAAAYRAYEAKLEVILQAAAGRWAGRNGTGDDDRPARK